MSKTRLYIVLFLVIALFFYLKSKGKLTIIKTLEESNEMNSSNSVNRPPKGTPGTTNFKLSEFHSQDGQAVPYEYYGNLSFLMDQLEVIRKYFGNLPIKIRSGYRSPAHNKAVGGVPLSMHLRAAAADIDVKGKTPAEVQTGIKFLILTGQIHAGGLGSYKTFTHYDIGSRRSW